MSQTTTKTTTSTTRTTGSPFVTQRSQQQQEQASCAMQRRHRSQYRSYEEEPRLFGQSRSLLEQQLLHLQERSAFHPSSSHPGARCVVHRGADDQLRFDGSRSRHSSSYRYSSSTGSCSPWGVCERPCRENLVEPPKGYYLKLCFAVDNNEASRYAARACVKPRPGKQMWRSIGGFEFNFVGQDAATTAATATATNVVVVSAAA